MPVASPVTWADLLTLLQFSVGANLAFATVLTLYDKVLVKKQKAISDLRAAASRIKNRHQGNGQLVHITAQTIQDVERLEVEVSRFAKQIEHVTYDIFRYIAICAAFFALGLLLYATYHTGHSASTLGQILTLSTVLPLFIFSMYALFWTSFKLWRFDTRRNRLDLRLTEALTGQ